MVGMQYHVAARSMVASATRAEIERARGETRV